MAKGFNHSPDWLKISNAPAILIAASGASYITTFIRERFYYQRGLGTMALDHIVVAVSVAAIISNMAGIAVSLSWAAGRLHTRFLPTGLALGVVLVAVAVITQSTVFFWIVLIVASYTYLVESQRAAQNGRLIYALLAAISAPFPTIIVWALLGTKSAHAVLAGYAVGAVWQAAGAARVGHGATITPTPQDGSKWWLPLLYIGAVQCDAVLDQILLLRAGVGWAGAGTMALTLSAAALVLFLGPMSTQALVSRLAFDKMRKLLIIGFAIAIVFEVAVYLVLPVILRGGSVAGVEYDRLFTLTLLYGSIIPFSFAWQLLSRIAHRAPGKWLAMSAQSVVIFGVHALILIPLLFYHLWYAFPLASVLAFGVGCLMMWRSLIDKRNPLL
jgi:hypothetical protein